jgi:hypothetical protein
MVRSIPEKFRGNFQDLFTSRSGSGIALPKTPEARMGRMTMRQLNFMITVLRGVGSTWM